MTSDTKDNFYVGSYSNATGGDAIFRVGIGVLTTPNAAVRGSSSATNVTTIVNDVTGCSPAPTLTFPAWGSGTAANGSLVFTANGLVRLHLESAALVAAQRFGAPNELQ